MFQKVDLYWRYAIEFDKNDVSERLLANGLTLNGVHVSFASHQKRVFFKQPVWRVYMPLLPSGVTDEEIISALQCFRKIKEVQPITKVIYQRRIDTGDKLVFFTSLHKDIPSYLNIRGWKAFLRYNNQPQTCRLCDKTGHFAKECLTNPRNKPDKGQHDDQPANEEMETHTPKPDPTPEEINSTPTMQEEEPHVFSNASLQKEERESNLFKNITIQDCTTTPTMENVTVLDCYTTSPTVENVSQEIEVTTEKKRRADHSDPDYQSTEVIKEKSGSKSYCPRCRVDSHSEAECWHSIIKCASKRKLPVGVSKPGKGVTKPKRFRSFKRFMQDLSLVVCKGKNTDNLQYLMEVDNRDELLATYLLATYRDFTDGYTAESIATANSGNVMDLWARYSSEDYMKESTEDQLKSLNEII